MPRTDFSIHPSKKTHLILTLSLVFIVLCSAFGLDYINWKRGNKSYFFHFLATTPIQKDGKALDHIIHNSLTSLGIQVDLKNSKMDEKGRIQIPISMTQSEYTEAAFLLEMEFQKARILTTISQTTEDHSNFFLWELQGGEEEQRASLLFKCPIEIVEIPEEPNLVQPKNRVALIVDDMGYSLKTLRDIKDLGLSLTIAILPYSPWAEETARAAQKNNLEVILHLPLESLNDYESNSSTQGLIHSRMPKKDVLETLDANLAQIPFIRGVNNHMGSKITAEKEIMSLILARLKEDNLYFIDSVTAGNSIAYNLAREMSVLSAFRHVFLDSEREEEYIRKQLIQLLRLAQTQGMAVGICHPYKSTLKVLSDNLGLFEEYNCETVFASQIVK